MKKYKLSIFIILFFVSVALNIYLGISSYIKSTYTPDSEDLEILAEMTKRVLESDQYQEIDSKEKVYAIKQGVNRFNVADPSSIFHYEVIVQTNNESYIFTCKDEECSEVSNEGWNYSRYSEEEPLLPRKKSTHEQQVHQQKGRSPDYRNFIIEDVKETSLFITPPATDPEASYPVYEIYVDETTQIVGYKNNLDELAKGDNVKVWVQEKDKEPAEKIFVNE